MRKALLYKLVEGCASPFPGRTCPTGSVMGYAKSRVAIERRDPDLEFGNLPVEFSGHEALALKVDAVHLRFCAPTALKTGQVSPQGATKIFALSRGFVSRDGARCRWLPKLRDLARRDDRGGSPGGDHILASARVMGPISSEGSDLLIRWDLLQHVRQTF